MNEKKILISNGSVICGNGKVFPKGWILIDGGKISRMGSSKPPSCGENTIVLDAQGHYVMPGFINAHTHLYSQLARGIPAGRMKSFGQVLKGLWWKLDRALTLEDVYVSATLG
ncbi:MAG TPA: amidohydrolase family protein, partial [bacterium]|nr:amidohydrolase family protein [bacterium]